MGYKLELPLTTDEIRKNFTAIVEQIRNLPVGTEMARSSLDLALIRGQNNYERDPLFYSDIFKQAAQLVESIERKVTYLIEAASGFRRQSGLWNTEMALGLLQSATLLMDSLSPDDARTKRLRGLSFYNGALLFRMIGDYENAANVQFVSAGLEIGAGNIKEAAISLLCGMVEKAFAALVEGDLEKIQKALSSLYTCYFNLKEALSDDWREFSGPVHLLETHWLAGVPYPSVNELMDKVMHYANTPKIWADTLTVISLFNTGEYDACLQNADANLNAHSATPSSSTADAILICLLAKARILARLGKKEEAELEYGKILSYNKNHGGYFVKAVAERELDRLH